MVDLSRIDDNLQWISRYEVAKNYNFPSLQNITDHKSSESEKQFIAVFTA